MNEIVAYVNANPMVFAAGALGVVVAIIAVVRAMTKTSTPTSATVIPITPKTVIAMPKLNQPASPLPIKAQAVPESMLPPVKGALPLGAQQSESGASTYKSTIVTAPPVVDPIAKAIDQLTKLSAVASAGAPQHMQDAAKAITAAIVKNLPTSDAQEPEKQDKSPVRDEKGKFKQIDVTPVKKDR